MEKYNPRIQNSEFIFFFHPNSILLKIHKINFNCTRRIYCPKLLSWASMFVYNDSRHTFKFSNMFQKCLAAADRQADTSDTQTDTQEPPDKNGKEKHVFV